LSVNKTVFTLFLGILASNTRNFPVVYTVRSHYVKSSSVNEYQPHTTLLMHQVQAKEIYPVVIISPAENETLSGHDRHRYAI
jgi:hypothetical protein